MTDFIYLREQRPYYKRMGGESDIPVLSFELQHGSFVPLSTFTLALERMNSRFAREVRASKSEDEPRLYIAEIRQGSIIVDLVQSAIDHAPKIGAGLETANKLFDFGKRLASLLNFFKGKGPRPEKITPADCDDVRALMGPPMQVENGRLSITARHLTINTLIIVDEPEARIIDNRAAALRAELQEKDEQVHREVLFAWHQVRNAGAVTGEQRSSPDRGIIQAISSKPRSVTFSDDETKTAMTHGDFNPLEAQFVVDVKVLSGPKGADMYRIQAVHDVVPGGLREIED